MATWRSGYAAACKAVYTGSIPVVALRAVQAIRTKPAPLNGRSPVRSGAQAVRAPCHASAR
jgi:hypothetical protein